MYKIKLKIWPSRDRGDIVGYGLSVILGKGEDVIIKLSTDKEKLKAIASAMKDAEIIEGEE